MAPQSPHEQVASPHGAMGGGSFDNNLSGGGGGGGGGGGLFSGMTSIWGPSLFAGSDWSASPAPQAPDAVAGVWGLDSSDPTDDTWDM